MERPVNPGGEKRGLCGNRGKKVEGVFSFRNGTVGTRT